MTKENNLYLKCAIDLGILNDYGFEYWESNEFNWFECYMKHCEGMKYTNVMIFTKSRDIFVKYNDDFDYNWLKYEEIVEVKEVKELIEAGLTETRLE